MTKTWEDIKSMSRVHRSASTAIINGLIYVVGGMNFSNQQTSVEAYDPKTNEWTVKTSFDAVVDRVRPMIVAFGGLLYAFTDKRRIRKYDSENETCAKVSSFISYKELHSSLILRIIILQIRLDTDHNIQSIIAVNGRLFAITKNGAYGFVTIDQSTERIALDYCGETDVPKDLSETHYITLHQCHE